MNNKISKQIRFLYVDQNRFRSLLTAREFTIFKESVVFSRFESPFKVLEELRNNSYQIALLPNDIQTSNGEMLIKLIRSEWSDLFIISIYGHKPTTIDKLADFSVQSADISFETISLALEHFANNTNDSHNVISSRKSISYTQNNAPDRELAEIL